MKLIERVSSAGIRTATNSRMSEEELIALLIEKLGMADDDAKKEAKTIFNDFDGSKGDDGGGEHSKGDGLDDVELANAANNRNRIPKE